MLVARTSAVARVVKEIEASLHRSRGGTGWTVPVDTHLCDSFFHRMGLDACSPLLAKLPQGVTSGASGPARLRDRSLRQYVRDVARQMAKLELLPRLLDAITDERGYPLIKSTDDADISRIVHYSLCLHLIARAMADEPEVADVVVRRLGCSIRSSSAWWQHLSFFEHAKLVTVEMTLNRFSSHRRSASIPSNFGRVGLPFNIMEAVLEDVRFGNGSPHQAAPSLELIT